MAKDDTMYVGANGAGRLKSFKLLEGEERIVTMDARPYLGNKGTTASAVTFTADNSGVVTLSGAAIASGVATVELIAGSSGVTTVKGLITLASGEKLVRKFYVKVADPTFGDDTAYQ